MNVHLSCFFERNKCVCYHLEHENHLSFSLLFSDNRYWHLTNTRLILKPEWERGDNKLTQVFKGDGTWVRILSEDPEGVEVVPLDV